MQMAGTDKRGVYKSTTTDKCVKFQTMAGIAEFRGGVSNSSKCFGKHAGNYYLWLLFTLSTSWQIPNNS